MLHPVSDLAAAKQVYAALLAEVTDADGNSSGCFRTPDPALGWLG